MTSARRFAGLFARSIGARPTGRRAVLALAVAAALVPLPGFGRIAVADTIDTPVCRIHLEKIDVTLTRARAAVEAATAGGLDAECAAMHGEVRAMLAVRNVYRRCITGSEQIETVTTMNVLIDQTTGRISARCAARSAGIRTD